MIVSITPVATDASNASKALLIRIGSGPVRYMNKHVTVRVHIHNIGTTIQLTDDDDDDDDDDDGAVRSRVSRASHRSWRSIEAIRPASGDATHIIIVICNAFQPISLSSSSYSSFAFYPYQ